MVLHGKVIKLLITILMVGLSSAAYSKDYQAGKNFTVIHSTVKQPPPLVEFFFLLLRTLLCVCRAHQC